MLEQVPEEQGSGEEHRPGSEGRASATATNDVAMLPRLHVLQRQPQSQVDVSQEQGQQAEFRQRQQRPEALQEGDVLVEGPASRILDELEVPVQVLDQETDQKEASHGQDGLLPYGAGQGVS